MAPKTAKAAGVNTSISANDLAFIYACLAASGNGKLKPDKNKVAEMTGLAVGTVGNKVAALNKQVAKWASDNAPPAATAGGSAVAGGSAGAATAAAEEEEEDDDEE